MTTTIQVKDIEASMSQVNNRGEFTITFSEVIDASELTPDLKSEIESSLGLTYTPIEEWKGKQNFTMNVLELTPLELKMKI